MNIMSDIKSLGIGIIGGLIVLFITIIIKKINRKYIKNQIKDEEEYLQFFKKIDKSNLYLLRHSFRCIFVLFFLVAIANIIPLFNQFIELTFGIDRFKPFTIISSFMCWFFIAALSWDRGSTLVMLNNPKKNISKRLEIISKLKNKIK